MLFLLAHAGHGEHGLLAGLLHPITGLDHLVAAVAVGILAARLRKNSSPKQAVRTDAQRAPEVRRAPMRDAADERAVERNETEWNKTHAFALPILPATAGELALPGAFVGGMIVGGISARLGVPLPGVEFGIALSLVAVGVALSLRRIGPTWVAASILALLAVFHGHAHLAEYDASTGLAGYAIGLVAATALLHAAGIAIAIGVDRFKLPAMTFARVAGVATLAFGVLKIAGVA